MPPLKDGHATKLRPAVLYFASPAETVKKVCQIFSARFTRILEKKKTSDDVSRVALAPSN